MLRPAAENKSKILPGETGQAVSRAEESCHRRLILCWCLNAAMPLFNR
jgi:hypothetical protein